MAQNGTLAKLLKGTLAKLLSMTTLLNGMRPSYEAKQSGAPYHVDVLPIPIKYSLGLQIEFWQQSFTVLFCI